jgi:iron(III) transport system permease protein
MSGETAAPQPRRPAAVLVRVTAAADRSGLGAAAAVVALTASTEFTATLLLHPTGTHTLAPRGTHQEHSGRACQFRILATLGALAVNVITI